MGCIHQIIQHNQQTYYSIIIFVIEGKATPVLWDIWTFFPQILYIKIHVNYPGMEWNSALNALQRTLHRSLDNLPQCFIAGQILLSLLLFTVQFSVIGLLLKEWKGGLQLLCQKSTGSSPLASSKLHGFNNVRKEKDLLDFILHSSESFSYTETIPTLATLLIFFSLSDMISSWPQGKGIAINWKQIQENTTAYNEPNKKVKQYP